MGFATETLAKGAVKVAGGSALGGALPLLGGGAAIVGGGAKAIAKVGQGHEGLRVHNGRLKADRDERFTFFRKHLGELYGDVGPGLHLVMPFTHGVEVISTQNRNMHLSSFMVMNSMDRQHEIKAKLTWGVVRRKDEEGRPIAYDLDYAELLYKAIIAARDPTELAESVGGICTESLRHILEGTENPSAMRNSDVQPKLALACGEELLHTYGSEIRRLNITSASYSVGDVLVNGRVGSNGQRGGIDIPKVVIAVPDIMGS